MQEDFTQFIGRNAKIVVIAPHNHENVRKLWAKEEFSFIGIPDPTGKLGRLYGQEWKLFKFGRMPALFVIDRKGKIAFAQYAKNMSDIPANIEILDRLK